MNKRKANRMMAWVLSTAMIITQFSAPVSAQATTIEGCTHHTEHTADCGYTEGAACTHTHDEDCGYAEGTPALPCTFVEEATPADATTPHDHDENCGYADAVIGADCTHQHTADCGYVEGTPCTFECPQCNPKDSGNVALGTSSITVTDFDKLEGAVQQRTVPVGTTLEALNLPTTLAATGFTVSDTEVVDSGTPSDAATTPAAISIDVVKWELDPENENNQGNSTYDPEQGAYCLTPILPKGYTLAEGVKLPEILVMVGGVNLLASTTYGAFSVTTESGGTAPTYTDKVLTLGGGTYTIAMASGVTSTSADKIVVSTGVTANITLDGVNIDVSGTVGACAFELQGNAEVNLTLKGTNTLKSRWGAAGLQVQSANGATAELTITAESTGSLNATGGGTAAGIGGGLNGTGGTITISGGTVTATGSSYNGAAGAGIGGGYQGAGGTITINGGTVTATGGGAGAADIGGGSNGGGAGTFSTGENGNAFIVATYISHQDNKGNLSGVIFEGTDGLVYGSPTISASTEIPAGSVLTIGSDQTATFKSTVTNKGIINVIGTLDATGATWTNAEQGKIYKASGATITGLNGKFISLEGYVPYGDLWVKGGALDTDYSYNGENRTLTVKGTEAITILGKTTKDRIAVSTGVTANITLNGVNIDVSGTNQACAFELTSGSTVNLTLAEGSTNTLKSGYNKAGLQASDDTTLIIDGAGSLNVTGGGLGAGIGGGGYASGGTITINGGTVTATGGGSGACIGGGYQSAGGTITINGGTVTATATSTGYYSGAGIGGGGGGGDAGTFSTGESSNAFIVASSIAHQGSKGSWRGVIFEGNAGAIYGSSITLATDAEIPVGKTLTIGSGKELIIDTAVALTNHGTIAIEANGTLTNNGTLNNRGKITQNGAFTNVGTFNNYGTIDNLPNGGTVNKPSQVEVSFALASASGTPVDTATYGDNIIITATTSEKTANRSRLKAAPSTVDFYLGSVANGKKLNSSAISVNNNVATLTITLTGDAWKKGFIIGTNTVTADFGGISGSLVDSTGTGTLTVTKATPTITAPTAAAITYGKKLSDSTLSSGAASANGVTVDGTFSWTSGDTKPAVSDSDTTNYEVTFTPEDTTNYTTATANIKIKVNPATLTITDGTVTTKEWDNSANATITALTFGGLVSGESLTLGTDYKVGNAAFANATVGNSKAITAGTATLLGTTKAKNYVLTNGGLSGKGITGNITQADQSPTAVTVSSYAPTFGGAAPTITQVSTSESATVTYTAVTDTTDSGTTSQVASITDKTITINKAGTFYVKAVIAATTNYKAKTIYSEAITVGQATHAKPGVPTSGTVSIANDEATVALATVVGQNYIYTTIDSTPVINGGTGWTTATGTTTNFTGLTIGTSYYFWTYIPGDDNHNPSAVSSSLEVKSIVAPTITTHPTSAAVIWDETASFTVAASGGQLTYQWQVSTNSGTNWSNIASGTGGTSATYTTPDTTKAMNDYQYKCVVTNGKGNATTNAATLTVNDKKISIAAITGVTAPTRGGTPVTAITATDEYTGTVSWSPEVASGGTFAADTIYTATITLTAKPSYTLTGVTANFFKVLGATGTNSASSGSVTAVFPTTEKDTYTITATPQTLDFDSLTVGYTRPNAQTVTVQNTGNMSVTVTLPTATDYDVTVGNDWSSDTATLAPNGTATFTVQPKAGLAVGSHNATLTANTGNSTSATVSLTFGVTEKAHEHSFGTEWRYDADNHWHECTANDNAKSALAAHTYGAWTITISATSTTAGSRTRTCTVCANSQTESIPATGGSSGGSTGGSGNSDTTPSNPPTVTPPDPNTPNAPTNGSTTIPGNPDNNGNVTVTIPDKNITDAINAAKQQAGKNAISVTANIQTTQTANSLTAILSKTALDTLISENVRELKIGSSLISYSFNLDALIEIQKSVTGNLTIVSAKQDVKKLSAAAQTAIGSRPVFNITMQSGSKTITQFGKGIASVWIPYIPTADENEGRLQAAYVDANGKVSLLTASSYSKNAKALLFSTDHFSVYGVAYKAPTPAFTDTAKHWAKNDIDFVAARGLLSGTGKTTFSPDTSMTRGMFVTALGRLAGVDTKKFENTKFTDVKADAYYSPYVAWANVNNIVNGTTATTFSPDQSITRQEMAVMLVNYSKAIGYKLPSVHAQITFTDSASIGTWAKDAVKQMQMAGILMGKSGNKFDPTATATRAEVSAMLRRYVELVVSTETAEGWAMNESGQWMYIQDGKRTTGKKTVDGKAYEFDQYGVTTALLPERKYGVHTVKKGESFWSIARKYKVSMFELTAANGKSIFSIIYTGEELKIPQK